jgi:hypothetical protein
MKELAEQAARFNRNSLWTADSIINSREFIRADLRFEVSGDQSISLRRWVRPDGELPQSTKRGLSCSIRHLPALAALLNEALHHARVKGLLPTEGGADTLLRDGGCS